MNFGHRSILFATNISLQSELLSFLGDGYRMSHLEDGKHALVIRYWSEVVIQAHYCTYCFCLSFWLHWRC